MTHDELLALLDKFELWDDWKFYPSLRAVVELHKPIKRHDTNEEGFCLACTPPSLNFYEAIRYPCPTIQAIEEELKPCCPPIQAIEKELK